MSPKKAAKRSPAKAPTVYQNRRWVALGKAVDTLRLAVLDDDNFQTIFGENIAAGLRAALVAGIPGRQSIAQADATFDAMVEAFLRQVANRLKAGVNPLGI